MLPGMGGVWFGFHWCCWLLIEVRFWFLCVCGHGDLFCFWLLYPLLAWSCCVTLVENIVVIDYFVVASDLILYEKV